jgi:glutamyl-tRNAGlu reductase-like protein
MNPPENSTAFSAPGIDARWTSSAKESMGRSRSRELSPRVDARCCAQRDRAPGHRGAALGAMNFFCLGLSHHTANVATREQFAGNATAESIARQAGCAEALLLTTCNRVEVYGVSNKGISTDEIMRCLMATTNRNPDNSAPLFYRYEDNKCAQHLFRVDRREPDFRTGKEGIRIDQNIGSSRSVFASFISTRVSCGKTGAHAHRHCARRGVGRFRRGRISSTNFWQIKRVQSACARRG